jgi:hypothetical protein
LDTRYDNNPPDYSLEEPPPSPLTVTHVVRTIGAYRSVIALSLLVVMVGYLILAVAIYLMAPAIRLTSLNFRLEFTGAEKGQYPNGAKFSSADIISTPVLLRAYKENNLDRFTRPADFISSVFVVESNEAREALAREYQARLADSRITSIDRERIQRDYELKAGSLSKNQFSINYARQRRDSVPDVLAKKVLHDILKNWADYASNDQHVLEYRISVLAPSIVAPNTAPSANPIVTTIVLRSKVMRLLENVVQIRMLPNAELMRSSDGLSLNDIAVRLDDAIRYRLDPLVDRIAASRLDDRAETLRFVSTQLAYDERVVQARKSTADAAQRTLALYMSEQLQGELAAARDTTATPSKSAQEGTESVTTQISESFIDRLIQLTNRSADSDFRQELAEEYQNATLSIVPAQQAVDYDRAVLETVRGSGDGAPNGTNAEEIAREIATTREEVRQLAVKVHELHKIVSRNLNSSTELLVTGTPRTRMERGVLPSRLLLIGVLVGLIALVTTVLLCLVHSRVRGEKNDEDAAAQTAPDAA